MENPSDTVVMACDFRIGRIVRVEPFPRARKPALKLWIDFGPLGVKKSSAQITRRYSADSLIGMTVVALVNLSPRQIADFMSEVLVLGAVPAANDVVLLVPDVPMPAGTRVSPIAVPTPKPPTDA